MIQRILLRSKISYISIILAKKILHRIFSGTLSFQSLNSNFYTQLSFLYSWIQPHPFGSMNQYSSSNALFLKRLTPSKCGLLYLAMTRTLFFGVGGILISMFSRWPIVIRILFSLLKTVCPFLTVDHSTLALTFLPCESSIK